MVSIDIVNFAPVPTPAPAPPWPRTSGKASIGLQEGPPHQFHPSGLVSDAATGYSDKGVQPVITYTASRTGHMELLKTTHG